MPQVLPHECPKCGWRDTRPSLRRGVLDVAAGLLLLQPIRCRKCLHRFFRFRTYWARFAVPAAMLVILFAAVFGYTQFVRGGLRRPNLPVSGEADRVSVPPSDSEDLPALNSPLPSTAPATPPAESPQSEPAPHPPNSR